MTLVEQYHRTREELHNLHSALLAKVRDEMVPGLSKGTTPLHEVRRINGQIGELLTILRNHFDEYELAKSQVLIACEIGDKYSTNQKSES